MLVMYTPQQSTVKSGPAHVKSRNMYIPPGWRDRDAKAGKSRQKREGWHLCSYKIKVQKAQN